MINKNVLGYICCPKCKGRIIAKNGCWTCNHCHRKIVIRRGNIVGAMPKSFSVDTKLSLDKWDQIYKKSLLNKNYERQKQEYDRRFLKDTLDQILIDYRPKKNDVYLEIGCGPMFLGQEIAKRGLRVIGIDFSLPGLVVAQKMLEKNKVKNYLLIRGDIQHMPLQGETVDLIYGGGVIEHFRNTEQVVSEMHRVLKKGGVCFNSVPQFNLSSLTYRQIWGNIPNVPILKQIAEWVHIKLLKKRHMRFGYELSFGRNKIEKIFQKQGFNKVMVRRFKCVLSFDYLKLPWLKRMAQRFSKLEIFNPMIFVIAKK